MCVFISFFYYSYDGIYKIVKYWPEKGKSGFIVWRYFLQRDDPVPPVWTPEGKKRAEQLGLDKVIVSIPLSS